MAVTEQLRTVYSDYSPGEDRPTGSYVVLMAAFSILSASFARWFTASGRQLPDRIDARDLALLTVACTSGAGNQRPEQQREHVRRRCARVHDDEPDAAGRVPAQARPLPRQRHRKLGDGDLVHAR